MKRRKPALDEVERRRRRYEFIDSLKNESDRGLALITAAFLDEKLRELLQAKFAQNFAASRKLIESVLDGPGPLETFSFRIKLSFLLMLIGDSLFRDLEVVREIRNHFAHDYAKADFNNSEVVLLTKALKSCDQALERVGSVSCFDDAHSAAMPEDAHRERARFILAPQKSPMFWRRRFEVCRSRPRTLQNPPA